MQRSLTLLIVGALVIIGSVFLTTNRATAADAKPAAVEIRIDNFSFGPASVTVPAGTEITWVNRDDIPHTVVSEDKSTFKSHPLDTDEKFTFKFDKPGTYTYFCSIHPKMTAKVVVQ
jgi:plastocyanin